MHRLLRFVWRVLVGFSAGALALIPVVLIAAWAFIYLVQIVQFALAPGVPLRYELRGAEGLVVLEADSYRIELPHHESALQMVLERPRASTVDGRNLASLDRMIVQYDDGVFDLTAGKGEAVLRRLADGQLEIRRLLPEATDEPPRARVRFRMGQAKVRFEDASPTGPVVRDVTLTDLQWHHALTDGLGGATVSLPDVGTFPVTAQAAEGGRLWIDTDLQGVDVAPLWPHVRRWVDTRGWGELRNLDARAFLVSGPVRFEVAPGSAPRFAGRWTVDATGVVAGTYLGGASLRGTVETDGNLWAGRLTAHEPGRRVDFDGALSWRNGLVVAGRVEAEVGSKARLWSPLARTLPGGASFRDGTFRGWVTYSPDGYFASGDLTAGQFARGQDGLTALRGQLRATDKGLALRAERATWLGRGVSGAFGIEWGSGRITGYASVENGPLRPVAARFGTDQVFGRGEAQILLAGTTAAPVVELLARGSGTAQLHDTFAVFLGDFQARLRIDGEGVTVQRFVVDGPNGAATVDGSFAWTDRRLALRVQGAAVPLNAFVEDVRGTAFFDMSVSGTVAEPLAEGAVELYGVEYIDRGFPQVIAKVRADRELVALDDVRALLGAARVTGEGTYTFDTRAIGGQLTAQDLLISDYFGPDVLGTVSQTSITVGGTLDDPVVDATGEAENVLAYGVRVDRVTGQVRVRGDEVEVDGRLTMDQGEATVKIHGDGATGEGTVQAAFEDFPLDRAPGQGEGFDLEGLASGTGSMTIRDRELVAAELSATVDDILVNGRAIGGGSLDARLADDTVTTSGQVGTLEGYIVLAPSTYSLTTRAIDLKSTVFNLAIADIVPFGDQWTQTLPQNGQRLVTTLRGSLSGDVQATGTPDDLTLATPGLLASDLRIGGRSAGRLELVGSYDSEGLALEALQWRSDGGTIIGTGSVGADDSIDLTIDATNFDLTWLNTVSPDIPMIAGFASATVVASGTVDDPVARASLHAGDFSVLNAEGERVQVPLDLIVDDIRLADRQVVANGNVFFRGLSARVEGRAPLSLLGVADPDAAPDAPAPELWGRVRLDPRQIDAFAEYATWLDTGRSSGTVEGEAVIEGPLDALVVTGGFQLRGERIALAGLEEEFTAFELTGELDPSGAQVTGQASSPFGGLARLEAGVTPRTPRFPASPTLADFADGALQGRLSLSSFRWRQKILTADEQTDATAEGVVTLAGTVRRPVVGGDVRLLDSTISAPTELPVGPGLAEYPLDVVFDSLAVTAVSGTRLKAAGADLKVRGSGVLTGSLSSPSVRVPLTVESGVFRLPTARVTIEPGGSLALLYLSQPNVDTIARLDVELDGRTTLAARGPANQFQSYAVTMTIRGNALQVEGLQFDAFSDPPDLSRDQILAALGQAELLEGIAAGDLAGEALRESLFAFAVPFFTQRFFGDLATRLQLDYVVLDYSPFEGAVINSGRTLGRGLLLQASRQLSSPAFGRQRWSVQLTYRLPTRDDFLSRLQFGIGVNQSSPWKFTINWGQRF